MNPIVYVAAQIISGAFTGYITNTYAINMLFKQYTPLKFGGVILKTKEAFIQNISRLIERDIINHKTIGQELSKPEFKQALEALLHDIFNDSLYEVLKEKSFGEVEGFNETQKNILQFSRLFLEKNLDELLDTALQAVDVPAAASRPQLEHVSNALLSELVQVFQSEPIVEKLMDALLKEHASMTFSDIFGAPLLQSIQEVLVTRLVTDMAEVKAAQLEPLFELLKKINYSEPVTKLKKSLLEKQLEQLVPAEAHATVIEGIKTVLQRFVSSPEGAESLSRLIEQCIEVLKNAEHIQTETVLQKLSPKIEVFLSNNLLDIIHIVTKQLRANTQALQGLLQEAVDETVDEISHGLRGMLLRNVGNGFFDDIANRMQAVEMLIHYLEHELDTDALSTQIVQWIVEKLKKLTISQLMHAAKAGLGIEEDHLGTWAADRLAQVVRSLTLKDLSQVFHLRLRDIVGEKPFEIDENVQRTLISAGLRQLLASSQVTEYIQNALDRQVSSLFNAPLKQLVPQKRIELAIPQIKRLLIDVLINNKNSVSRRFSEFAEDRLKSMTLSDILTEQQRAELEKESKRALEEGIGRLLNELSSVKLSSVIDLINQGSPPEQVLSASILNALNANLESLLRGKIEKMISHNLHKLNENELSTLIHDFMGRELRPITAFGAVLGGFAGLVIGLMLRPGASLWSFQFSVLSPVLYAFIGIMTNVIALGMIFRPYKKIRFLSRLPLFKLFSQGYISKNKPEFADSMADFVKQDLLDAQSIHAAFIKQKAFIRSQIFRLVSAREYNAFSLLLKRSKDLLSHRLSDRLKHLVLDKKSALSQDAVRKASELHLQDVMSEQAPIKVADWLQNSMELLRAEAGENLSKLKQSDKTLLRLLKKLQGSGFREAVADGLAPKIIGLAERLKDSQCIKTRLCALDEQYQRLQQHTIQSLVRPASKKRAAIDVEKVHQYISELIDEKALATSTLRRLFRFIRVRIIERINEDKTVEHVFNGKLKDFIAVSLDGWLKNAERQGVAMLVKSEDQVILQLQERIFNALSAPQRLAYRMFGGDALVRRTGERFIRHKLPAFIERQHNALVNEAERFANKRIYTLAVDVDISQVACDAVTETIANALKPKSRIRGLRDAGVKCVLLLLMQLSSVPLKFPLKALGLSSMQSVYARFEGELTGLCSAYGNTLMQHPKDAVDTTISFLDYSLTSCLRHCTMQQMLENVTQEQLSYSLDPVLKALSKSSAVSQALEEAVHAVYRSAQKAKLSKWINMELLERDISMAISSAVENDELGQVALQGLQQLLDEAADSRLVFIAAQTKEQLSYHTIDAVLSGAEQNLSMVINSVELDTLTRIEINRMDAREIHRLFNAFAGQYFTRLKLYGVIGGIFGLHLIAGPGMCVIYFIGEGMAALKRRRQQKSTHSD